MTDVLLSMVLLVGIATLAVAIAALRSSRKSENLGEDRYELLRDQHDRLEMLREERRMLTEQLERESRERQQLTEYLEETDPRLRENMKRRLQARIESEREVVRSEEERRRLQQEHQRVMEELERERRGHQEILRRAEGLEREQKQSSGIQQEVERLRQERQRLAEDFEREREEHLNVQRRAERQERERARLKQEIRQSQAEPNHRKRSAARDGATESGASRSWWRRPLLVVGLLLGVLIAWFTSLAVALNVLAS